MDRLFEFVVNHYILVSLFVVLLAALFLLETRRGGRKISPQAAVGLINRDEAVILDIRDRKEVKEGSISGSIHIPLSGLKDKLTQLNKHKDKEIIVVDKMGQHSATAVKQLNAEGFDKVSRLNGGIAEWRASNLPLVKK
ncbi:rhodanese-like domain-containing protein [Marinobacter sp.]|uniref:rhodanese-like domain-containing protein n=1 Tax=Marinobacter sp. TaxID=50741 RepID=UPI00384B8D8F